MEKSQSMTKCKKKKKQVQIPAFKPDIYQYILKKNRLTLMLLSSNK